MAEKNQLLDYVEDNVKQIESLGQALEEERVKIEQISSDKSQLSVKSQELESTV